MNYYEFLDLCFSKIHVIIRYDVDNNPIVSCGGACYGCIVHEECNKQAINSSNETNERHNDVKRYLKDHPEYLI